MFRLNTSNLKPETNLSMNPYLSDDEIAYIAEAMIS